MWILSKSLATPIKASLSRRHCVREKVARSSLPSSMLTRPCSPSSLADSYGLDTEFIAISYHRDLVLARPPQPSSSSMPILSSRRFQETILRERSESLLVTAFRLATEFFLLAIAFLAAG